MARVCKHVTYSGRVQGVGFRYTARGLAAGYPVTGYVRNLRSGEVELVAEGEEESVTAFLDAIAGRMAGYVTRAQVEDVDSLGLSDFRIRT